MLRSFHHTGFVVRDIDSSVSFYNEVMGLKLLFQRESSGEFTEKVVGFKGASVKVAFLSMGNGHNLELIQYIVPPGAESHANRNDLGASHLAFIVENIEELHATLSQKGLRFVNPPASHVQDGAVLRKVAYAQDPDGNWLEFIEDVPQ